MSEYKNTINLAEIKKLIPEKYSEVEFLSHGKRGVVMKAKLENQEIAIKLKREESKTTNAILLEAKNLQEANKLEIGPKLLEETENYVVMEYIKGIKIKDYLEKSSKEEILATLSVLFYKLFKLDKAQINKYEMTNPHKHIIVKEDMIPVMIDFERARKSLKPKNITQFSQYLMSKNIISILQEKNILKNKEEFKKRIIKYSKDKKEFEIISYLS